MIINSNNNNGGRLHIQKETAAKETKKRRGDTQKETVCALKKETVCVFKKETVWVSKRETVCVFKKETVHVHKRRQFACLKRRQFVCVVVLTHDSDKEIGIHISFAFNLSFSLFVEKSCVFFN